MPSAVREIDPVSGRSRTSIYFGGSRRKSLQDSHSVSSGRLTIARKETNNFQKLYDFLKEGKYVDITLKFDDGQQISCHRNILASSSDYFDKLFSNGMKESSEKEIHVSEISSEIFGSILEFIYAGQCSFAYDHFFELLRHANMYELKDLHFLCSLISAT